MTRLAIHVSQGDIISGRCGDSSNCALAKAVQRRFKGNVTIGRHKGHFFDKSKEIARCNLTDGKINFNIPSETWDWMRAFDTWQLVKPTILYLDIYTTATTEDLSSPENTGSVS